MSSRSLRAAPLAVALLFAVAATAAAAAPSQGPAPLSSDSIQATRLSAEQVKLGEAFTDELVIQGGQTDWHANNLPPDSPFSLLGQSAQASPGGEVVKLRLGLYALGEHALPPITLVAKSGATLVVPAEGKITASSTLAKGDSQLRPLAGPRVPRVLDRLRLALAAIGSLLILTLLALFVRFAAAWIREGRSQEKRDRRTLDALLHSRCSDLEFYLVLDGIVRRHLERRHGIPAQERTAAELQELLGRAPIAAAQELARLFGDANLIKFAKRAAQPGQRETDGQLAVRVLREPKPKSKTRGSHAASQLS